MYVNVSTKLSGGGTASCTLQLGSSIGASDLFGSFDIFTAAVFRGNDDSHLGSLLARATSVQNGWMPSGPSPAAWGTIYGRVTTTGANVSALTQGSMTIYIEYVAF